MNENRNKTKYHRGRAGRPEKISGSGKLKSKFAMRLTAIINRASGKTLESIADFPALSLSSVIRCVKRFNSGRLESLLKDKTRKPGKAPVSVETKNRICAIACNEKPKNAAHWSVRSLDKRAGISKSAVNNILRERGIKPHLTETFRFSGDEKFEEKRQRRGRALYEPVGQRDSALCGREITDTGVRKDPPAAYVA
jgi:transposase